MMDPANQTEATLRLKAEELAIGAERVFDRDVTVGRDVVATNVRFDVSLLAEAVRIAEEPVSQAYADVPPIGEAQRIVVRLSRERAHVALRVVEYERVSIGTREIRGNAHFSTSLAHEELAIERPAGEHA